MNRSLLVLLGAACLALVVWGLWPRAPLSEADRIRAVIDEMARAVSERRVGDVMEHFSDSYTGELGDKRGVHAYLAGAFLRSEMVFAMPSGVEASVNGDAAEVSLRLTLARSPDGRADDTLGSHLLDTIWVREEGDWRVRGAKRKR